MEVVVDLVRMGRQRVLLRRERERAQDAIERILRAYPPGTSLPWGEPVLRSGGATDEWLVRSYTLLDTGEGSGFEGTSGFAGTYAIGVEVSDAPRPPHPDGERLRALDMKFGKIVRHENRIKRRAIALVEQYLDGASTS